MSAGHFRPPVVTVTGTPRLSVTSLSLEARIGFSAERKYSRHGRSSKEPSACSSTAQRTSRPSSTYRSHKTSLSKLKAVSSASSRLWPSRPVYNVTPMELSSLQGFSTNGGDIRGRSPFLKSSASGTRTPAAATTARDCALFVDNAMVPASLPTSGICNASKIARYVVIPGRQNMCGTHTAGANSTMACMAWDMVRRSAAALESTEKSHGKLHVPSMCTIAMACSNVPCVDTTSKHWLPGGF
mmetsp:Transcript_31698/g.95798  ORF Transcript_31698/g.95798 Transcript_31698/m.95798 type:complete len:242 (+) Transcript_31698:581-1306(+)